jgi:hypothetical protein
MLSIITSTSKDGNMQNCKKWGLMGNIEYVRKEAKGGIRKLHEEALYNLHSS